MNATEGWDQVEVLVNRRDDGRLETVQSTLDRLSSIKSPVHVVAVAGPYRTGKSYLLNVIIEALFGKTNVFPVGGTVQAQTRGIAIWCSPHPSVKGHWIIFLDTEGLNDVEKGDRDSDVLMFVLTVLLSSTLVYNSCGVIDFRALETIHHVSVLAERIRMMPNLGEDDLEDIGFDLAFPELLWVVRDFQLNLEVNGTRITDDEYLENALSTSNMVLGPTKATVVSVKRCIKEYFAKRKCFLLPNLPRCKDSSMTACSRQRDPASDLIDQVAMAECKMHQGSEVTGRVLGKLAEELVEECQRLDSQEPVNVQGIMERIAEKENSAAVAKSLALYRTEMSEKTAEPVDEVTLHQIHFKCSELAATNIMHAAVYPVDDGFIRLMNAIKLEFDKISQNNAAKINELCNQTFKALRKEIIGDNNTRYLCSGGFQKYREDMTKLRQRWEQNPVLQGVAGRSFFSNMLSRLRENEAKLIMDADKSMTELKRKEAVEERKRLEELKKQKDEKSANALERDRNAFEDRVTNQVRGAILRPQEAEISKLNCRISVLDRELSVLRARHAEDEAETCEQRLRTYQRILSEKQNQPSKWQKVSTSIQTFARGTFDSIKRLFRISSVDTTPCCASTVAEPDRSSPSVSYSAPSRASSCAPSSTSSGASASPGSSSKSAVASGSSSAQPVASTAGTPGSSSTASPGSSSQSAATSTAAASSSAPPVASTTSSSGSSSSPPVASTAASSGSSSSPPVASTAASPGSSSTAVSPGSSSTAVSPGSSSTASPGSSSTASPGSSSTASPGSSSQSAATSTAAASASSSAPPVASTTASPGSSSTPPVASASASPGSS